MARLNVYLPDKLAEQARAAGLNLSALAQDAVRRSLASRSTDAWLSTISAAPGAAVSSADVLQALDEVREEPLTRHG